MHIIHYNILSMRCDANVCVIKFDLMHVFDKREYYSEYLYIYIILYTAGAGTSSACCEVIKHNNFLRSRNKGARS